MYPNLQAFKDDLEMMWGNACEYFGENEETNPFFDLILRLKKIAYIFFEGDEERPLKKKKSNKHQKGNRYDYASWVKQFSTLNNAKSFPSNCGGTLRTIMLELCEHIPEELIHYQEEISNLLKTKSKGGNFAYNNCSGTRKQLLTILSKIEEERRGIE